MYKQSIFVLVLCTLVLRSAPSVACPYMKGNPHGHEENPTPVEQPQRRLIFGFDFFQWLISFWNSIFGGGDDSGDDGGDGGGGGGGGGGNNPTIDSVGQAMQQARNDVQAILNGGLQGELTIKSISFYLHSIRS